MSASDAFLKSQQAVFEDFWNRRLGDSFFELDYPAFGYNVHLTTNAREVLDAARLSALRYCHSTMLIPSPVVALKVMVVPGWSAPPPPPDLPARIQTVGIGDYLVQAATPWLQWFLDRKAHAAYGFISGSLAADQRLVSRYVLDRSVTNLLLSEGVGQVHATSLVGNDHALLFIAPHGTGKSTTAFHLLSAGYRLMGDGLLYIRERAGQFELMGYPVGEAKMTAEMQPYFPEWNIGGHEVTVHNVNKRIINLREIAPEKIVEQSVCPARVLFCLIERKGDSSTHAVSLTADETFECVLPDTIHYDTPERMSPSLSVVRGLIERAECVRLTIGSDREELVRTILGITGG